MLARALFASLTVFVVIAIPAAAMSACETAQAAAQRLRAQPLGRLSGRTIAILATDGFEQEELTRPRDALAAEGASTVVVAPHGGSIQGYDREQAARLVRVDLVLREADPTHFDGLYLPGGVRSPDALRSQPEAVAFVRAFADQNKPIAALCHGAWTLVEADVVRGKLMTSWPSLKTDLRNAGAQWVDMSVVRDGQLVTSRAPDDLPAFLDQAIELYSGPVVATAPVFDPRGELTLAPPGVFMAQEMPASDGGAQDPLKGAIDSGVRY